MKKYSCIIDSLPGKIDQLYDYQSSKEYDIGDVIVVEFNKRNHLGFICDINAGDVNENLIETNSDVICSKVFNIDDTKIINFYVNKYNFGYFEMLKRIINLDEYNYNWQKQIFAPKITSKYYNRKLNKIGRREEFGLSQYTFKKQKDLGEFIRLEKRSKLIRDYSNQIFGNIIDNENQHFSDLLKNNYHASNVIIDLNLVDNSLSFETIVSDIEYVLYARGISYSIINVKKVIAKYENYPYNEFKSRIKNAKLNEPTIIVRDHIIEQNGELVQVDFLESNRFFQSDLLGILSPRTKVCKVNACLTESIIKTSQVILIGDYNGQKISQILSRNSNIKQIIHFGSKLQLSRKGMIILKSKIEQEGFAAASKLVNILKARGIECSFEKAYFTIFKNAVCYKIEIDEDIPINLIKQFQEIINTKIYYRSEV